jgi:hypothetical protein
MIAPICLFTYNRLVETKQTIEALKLNFMASSSDLFIFSDGPKIANSKPKVEEVRQYLRSIDGFRSIEIFESNINKGLANSIIEGVTMIVKKYGKVIVLEDDLVSSPNFLSFMNQSLDFYYNDKRIQSINGYSLLLPSLNKDVYFQIRPFPWGWATWSDRWEKEIFDKQKLKFLVKSDRLILKEFKKVCGDDISEMLLDSLENRNDSWYVRWTFDHFRRKNYSVFPNESYIQNIGHNLHSTHCKGINTYVSKFVDGKINHQLLKFYVPDKNTVNEFLKYFSLSYKLKFRIKLLSSALGRRRLIEEFKNKFK